LLASRVEIRGITGLPLGKTGSTLTDMKPAFVLFNAMHHALCSFASAL